MAAPSPQVSFTGGVGGPLLLDRAPPRLWIQVLPPKTGLERPVLLQLLLLQPLLLQPLLLQQQLLQPQALAQVVTHPLAQDSSLASLATLHQHSNHQELP